MTRRVLYRRQLLRAVEGFLEDKPETIAHAHGIIQRCYRALHKGNQHGVTLDDVTWHFFVQALTDSVFYEDENFLRETREILLGHVTQELSKTVFMDDYRTYFTEDEAKWYTQLLSLYGFIMDVPFGQMREAAREAREQKMRWEMMRASIPEITQAEAIDEEYTRRTDIIKALAAKSPAPVHMGDEKIHHLMLREVTSILAGIGIGRGAIYWGYPISNGSFSWYGNEVNLLSAPFNMMESVRWTKKMLDAIAGHGVLFISWRLSKEPSSFTEMFVVSVH